MKTSSLVIKDLETSSAALQDLSFDELSGVKGGIICLIIWLLS